MTWFVWRQQRTELLIFGAIMAAVAALVLKTGLDMRASYQHLGVAGCIGAPVDDPRCGDILGVFHQRVDPLNTLFYTFELTPIALAFLLAAPYIHDLEQGTYRLAWTQSITRLRWVLVRAGLLGSAAILASLACSFLMAWWHGPLARLSGATFSNISFDTQGVAPVAYTVFALALVLAVGTLLRRTIPAGVLALVVFAAIRACVEILARPGYLPPIDKAWTSGSIPIGPRDWLISKGEIYRDRLGHTFSFDGVDQLCGRPSSSPNLSPAAVKDAYIACYNHYGLSEIVRYQPADRYWLFQGIECAIFLGLAGGLFTFTAWWIKQWAG